MGFQNTINNALGAAGAAVALGKHISNQNKQIELEEAKLPEQIIETDKALEEAETEKESILENNPEVGAPGADQNSPEIMAYTRAANRADMLIKAKTMQLGILEKRFNKIKGVK